MSHKFLEYCALTCMGGSEKKLCPCINSGACELKEHPRFQHYRNMAIGRMYNFMSNDAGEKLSTFEFIKRSCAAQRRRVCEREGKHADPYIHPCPECGTEWKNGDKGS